MSITFAYKDVEYPFYIRNGYHSQYIIPIAKQVCKGSGIDIGANNQEWAFPGAKLCDKLLGEPWNNACVLPVPDESQDYVFSSHCLEHIENYLQALLEWKRVLKKGGVLFLYLPHWNCEYWRVSNNLKHLHNFNADELKYTLSNIGFNHIFASGMDLAYSFSIYGEK